MKRLLIDHQDKVLRIACLTDRKLTEIFIDHEKNGSLVGHIINGVVKNILPSRFAFIDIGQEKNAFMNLPDNHSLKTGQYIAVQVRKDATGDKGPNVSEVLQFKGRMAIIYHGQIREIGVSQKINDQAERRRLKKTAAKFLPPGYSAVMRTQSTGASEETIKEELEQLIALCNATVEAARYAPALKVLYRDNLIVTDLLTEDLDEIILTDAGTLSYLKAAAPSFRNRIRLWDGNNETKLFDAFDVERQLLKALHRKVWLPCGGFVTFDPVEACVVIDVNTGKFMGKKNYQETILKTNLEAAEIIAEQIALRNLSGMIIVDFIDMPDETDKNKLLTAFGQALKRDRIPADIVGMTSLGLVQLTRRKQREPLYRLLQQSCPHCGGTGRILKLFLEKGS